MLCESTTIEGLLTGFRTSSARPSTLVDSILSLAAARNIQDCTYTQLLPCRAADGAGRIDALLEVRSAAGVMPLPLLGVPVVIKDNIDLLGTATSCGSLAFARPQPARDAAIVRRLDEMGAIILGKTNLDEAALGASGRNAIFGRCINPRDERLLSGGSSSGSAAAVAAGHALLGIGTDTLGSVRIPAAFCGLVGFKPTHGLLIADGVAPLYPAFDTLGLITRTLDDAHYAAAALLNVERRSTAPAARDLQLAFLPEAALIDTDRALAEDYRRVLHVLHGSPGVQLLEFPAFDFSAVSRAALWEVAAAFAENSWPVRIGGATMGSELSQLLDRARSMPAKKLDAGRELLRAAANFLRSSLDGCDGVLTPTCPVEAIDADAPVPKSIANFVAAANVAGLPAVSWPLSSGGGRSTSLQLIGRAGTDFHLLSCADKLQKMLGEARN
jgi:aspartyl-tRNA(Asn)/glutamyl-tRNA(Gln) amidotransferase subunit A